MTYSGRPFVFLLVIIAIGLFLVLIGTCIVLYPGGVYTDPSVHGYSWTMNFFSDLGRTRLFNGQPNRIDRILFTIALSIVGIVFIPFFMVWQSLFRGKKAAHAFAIAGTVFGDLAGIAYILVAFTPWDIYQSLHIPANQTAFFAMMLMSCCYITAMIAQGNYTRIGIVSMALFALLNIGYLWLLFFGPSYTTPTGLTIQVIGQKTIVFVEVVVLFIQAWITKGMTRVEKI